MLVYEEIFYSIEIFIQLVSIASLLFNQRKSRAVPICGIMAHRGRAAMAHSILTSALDVGV